MKRSSSSQISDFTASGKKTRASKTTTTATTNAMVMKIKHAHLSGIRRALTQQASL